MFKFLYWKIREWIEEIVYGPAECPKYVRDAMEELRNRPRPHLMTDEEYVKLIKEIGANTEQDQTGKYFNGMNNRFILSAGATHLYDGSLDRCGIPGMRSSY